MPNPAFTQLAKTLAQHPLSYNEAQDEADIYRQGKEQLMLEYLCILRDEDGMEFSSTFSADDREHVREQAAECFPESTVIEINSPADIKAREEDLYIEANDRYDNPWLDDYEF